MTRAAAGDDAEAAGDAHHRLVILHDDGELVAVHKPAGLAAHRSHLVGNDDDYLVDAVRAVTGRTLYLAHRLDRATSGVVVLAADKSLVAALGAQFMARTVGKRYLAVVRGHVDEAGVVDHPLDAPGKPDHKPAITRYRRRALLDVPVPMGRYAVQRYSLVEVEPETGRYRQIRRHFKHISHHVIGDTSHGRGEHNRLFKIEFGIHRLLLHAWSLELDHPTSGVRLAIVAPPEGEMARAIALFGADATPQGGAIG